MSSPEMSDTAKLAQFIIYNGFATGHGDSVDSLLSELQWQLDELRERLSQQAHHQRVVDAAAAAIAAERDRYREDAERLRDGVTIGVYAARDGHRDWWSGGTWLNPGEEVMVVDAAKDAK